MLERRTCHRYWMNRNATVLCGKLILAWHCRVRDMSLDGAGVWLGGAKLLPVEFDLVIDGYQSPRRCRVAWRWGDFVGLRFPKK